MNPLDDARAFVEERFPDCMVAFLAGSVVRGEATATSDLDIVIITDRPEAPFRESLFARGWPVEVFVHTLDSYLEFFAKDASEGTPSLQMMCAEGIVLRDRDGLAEQIKDEARAQLERGPQPLTQEQIDGYRYSLTDMLDDFAGSKRFEESMFIANDLGVKAAELILFTNRRWIGHGKWVMRALLRFDPALAERLSNALRAFYRDGIKENMIKFIDDALAPVGGRLFAGYSLSGKLSAQAEQIEQQKGIDHVSGNR